MKQRLIILIPGFPQDEAETNCLPAEQRLVRGLRDHAPDVELVILTLQYPWRSAEYEWEGIRVIAFGGRNRSGLYRRWLWSRVAQKLQALIAERDSVLLSFWYDEGAALAERVALRTGIRHCCWMRGQDARVGNRYVQARPIAASRLIAISEAQAGLFARNYGYRPATVLPNAVHGPLPEVPQARPVDLLAVGSLIPLKQFGIFLEVVRQLRKEFPSLQAFLCGDGPEMKALRRMARESGLDDCVKFLGEVPNPAVQQLMLRSKILLHPSSYEGFSTVCLEALAAGMQVISFQGPMKRSITHWHVVPSAEEMGRTCAALLRERHVYRSVAPFTIPEVVAQLRVLLFPGPEAIPETKPLDGICKSMP